MDSKDIVIVAFLALLALSLSFSTSGFAHFLTQESYAHALNVEKVVKGEAPSQNSLFYNFAAFAYARMSAGQEFSLDALGSVLRLLPGLFALVAAASAYLALRPKFSQEISAAASLLLITSLAFVSQSAANIVSPVAFGLALFLAGYAVFAYSVRKKWVVSLAGGTLVGLSALAWEGCVLAFVAFSLGLLAELAHREALKEKRGNFTYAAAAMVLLPIPFALFANPFGVLSIFAKAEIATMPYLYILLVPFAALTLIAAVSKALKRREVRRLDMFVLASALFSFAIAPFSAAAALPGLLLACAAVLNDLPELLKGKNTALAFVFVAASYASSAALSSYMRGELALLLGFLIGAVATFVAAMYEGERLREYVRLAFFAVVAFASISAAIAFTQGQSDPVSEEVDAAFAWIRANAGQGDMVGVAGGAEMATYLSQREAYNDTDAVSAWLLGNSSASALGARGIDYLVVGGASAFDNLEQMKNESGAGVGTRIDSFIVGGMTYDQAGAPYLALYTLYTYREAYIPLDSTGSQIDMTKDAMLPEGGSNRKVSAARFIFLRDTDGMISRAILPYENYNINLFNAFFGEVSGLRQVYPSGNGTTRVFRVG